MAQITSKGGLNTTTIASSTQEMVEEYGGDDVEVASALTELGSGSSDKKGGQAKGKRRRRKTSSGNSPAILKIIKKSALSADKEHGVTKRHHTKESITKNHHSLKDKNGVYVRPFSYLSYMGVTAQWTRYSRPLLRQLLKECEVKHIAKHGPRGGPSSCSSSSSSSESEGSEWLTTEEVLEELTMDPLCPSPNYGGDKAGNILRPPKIGRSAYEFMANSLDQIGQRAVLGYNGYCRRSKRTTISSTDIVSQILSVHGLKHGSRLLSNISKIEQPSQKPIPSKKVSNK